MERFQDQLYDELEIRQRAIANWKRLRIIIVLMQVCGGNLTNDNWLVSKRNLNDDKKASSSIRERIAPYVINPMNRYKVTWDLSLGVVYLAGYLMDPFIFALHF